MLKYNIKALQAIPKLFAYRNDVDIFTEDKVADKEFYRTLFKNLLGNKIKINDVTPLGCKENVITAHGNQENTGRKRFYIIDGDLDLIDGEVLKSRDNLIVLDSYCIENYLIDEGGAVEFIYYSLACETKDVVRRKLNFEKWLSYNSESLVHLFINFRILKNIGGGPELRHACEFIQSKDGQAMLDREKVWKYFEATRAHIIERMGELGELNPQKSYDVEFARLISRWPPDENSLLRIVSAKNYLLPLLQFRINHCAKKKALLPTSSIKLFLADRCGLERLSFLRDKIAS